jgi:hypothetical protein
VAGQGIERSGIHGATPFLRRRRVCLATSRDVWARYQSDGANFWMRWLAESAT